MKMPSSAVAWVREGGIVESVYIHEGTLKEVGRYLLETVNQSNIAEFMSQGDRHNIIDTDEGLEESELHKSLTYFFESSNSDFFFIFNRVGIWEVATGENKRLNNLENVLSQVSSENEFTTTGCNLDIEKLKAEIIDELMELLPEVILGKFDEHFGIKPPIRH